LEVEKKSNPFRVFSQALQVPSHSLRTPATRNEPENDVPDDDEDDEDRDPDHENNEFESAESEYELDHPESEEGPGSEEDTDSEHEDGDTDARLPTAVTRAGRRCRPPDRYTPS
jgi:hypothetical protein